ncbi:MAG: hypothetical protein NVS9B12_05540 [Vulcanimicrobiaceae bacterium]
MSGTTGTTAGCGLAAPGEVAAGAAEKGLADGTGAGAICAAAGIAVAARSVAPCKAAANARAGNAKGALDNVNSYATVIVRAGARGPAQDRPPDDEK